MANERRAHPRFPLILAVQYVGAESVRDYTENLSAAGLFIRTERDFGPGERVTLVVSFPQLLEPVELQVEILRRRHASLDAPAGVAVRVPPDCTEDLAKLAEIARKVGPPRGDVTSLRVLLVEDNALVASMYAAALRRLAETDGLPEFAVEVAGDGAAALDRLMAAPPVDVLVTDLFMPILSGISLVEKVRAEPSIAHLPIVVITSGGDRERERLSGMGIELFLRKPVSYQDVAGVMRTLIGARTLPTPVSSASAAPGGAAADTGLTEGSGVGPDDPNAIPASRR